MLKSLCEAIVGTEELRSCWMYAGIAGLFALFDVAYFLRGLATATAWTVYSRLVESAGNPRNAHVLRANLLSPCWTWGICWFSDLDLMFHMNNSRYLRECDFARFKFLISCGLGAALKRTGFQMVLGASTIRYRRSIGLFESFTIATQVLAWDEKSLFIEHKFLRSKDNFVYAIVMVKQSLVNGTIDALFKAALTPHSKDLNSDQVIAKDVKEVLDSPVFPEELTQWIESNNISSQKLNPQKQNQSTNHDTVEQTAADNRQDSEEQAVADSSKDSQKADTRTDDSSPKPRLRYLSEEKRDSK